MTPSRANYTFSPSQRTFSQLGHRTDATFTANADTNLSANAIDTAEYFVRQQYLDFLGREPDQKGFNFWDNEINSCGMDRDCLERKRVDVSAAFFYSIEFQQTGFLVYRMNKAAYGNLSEDSPVPVKLADFLPDTRKLGQGLIVNQKGWESVLANNQQSFAGEFVQRARFTSAYPNSMTPTEFVDRLFANAGVSPSAADRAAALAEFGTAPTSGDVDGRARALRDVTENQTLGQQEFNRAFVLMEYFGYLQRNANDPPDGDFAGYNYWLGKLNSFGGDYRGAEMVKAFISSTEYRERFGQ